MSEFLLPRENYVITSSIKDWSTVKTGSYVSLMYCPMVSWYNDKIGKAFNRFDNETDALEWATVMFENDDYDVSYMQRV